MPNGDGGGGGGFSFGDFFGGLLDSLVSAIQAIIDFLYSLVQAIVQALNYLYAGEQAIFGFAFAGDKILWAWIKGIWSAIYHGVIVKALSHLLSLYQQIQAWAKKLKSWLDRWHALTRKYQVAAFRRAVNLIQRVRKMLVIFRVLHLKFATKLDNWLVGIESRLVRREMEIARKTNEIIAWVNLVADPTTLFRQVPLLRSLGRSIRDMIGGLNALGVMKLFPWLAQTTGPGVAQRPWSDVAQQFHSEVKNNSGDWGAFQQQARDFRALFGAGYSTK